MSITLTTGKLVQINGATVENNTTGATMNVSVDYFSNTLSFTLRQGVIAQGNLNAGQYGDTVTVALDLTTGNWTSSNGLSGKMTGSNFTQIQSQFKADRNLSEVLSAGPSGIMPGTQVPWP